MKAIIITRPGGPEVLELRDVPAPEPGPEEILVSVKATAVNRLDLLQRMGRYPAPAGSPQEIPGVEYAGVVERTGERVTRHQVSDRVFGLVGGGSYAGYVVAHERTAMPIPDGLSFTEAAAIPEAFITAFDAMVLQAGMQKGETVLINAAGSGVGVAAFQLARALGAHTIGTSRNAAKIEAVKALGLEQAIVPVEGKFAYEVMNLTGGKGVDLVLELAGGAYLPEDMACMAQKGRLVVVGLVAGASAQIDLGILLRKRLLIKGTVMRARGLEEKIAVAEIFSEQVLPIFASGKLKPVVDRVFPLAEAAAAHELVSRNENVGKVVLEL